MLTNVGASQLYFNGGSRTFISTPAQAANGNALVDLKGNDAEVVGGLFVNNGWVYDSTGANHRVVADFGSLVKGAGAYQPLPRTINGGTFAAGNSPGQAKSDRFVFGPDDVSNYLFYINDATGTSGPTPDAAGRVDGSSLIDAVDFVWAADASNKVTINLQTLLNPTTVGSDVLGPMANFDPTKPYNWAVVRWTGSYAGPTDVAALNAATVFNTNGFGNSFNGTFAWNLDLNSGTLYPTYTPA